jgi:uncharacterized protein
MRKIVGLRIDIDDNGNEKAVRFKGCVGDLLDADPVKKLDMFKQHWNTSRLQHSINVAYYSYRLCKIMGLDSVSAARAGMLHDFYLYDWRGIHTSREHSRRHPVNALENARAITRLNAIEEDAIVRHMFPIGGTPKFKESYIVSFADKYCAAAEYVSAFGRYVKGLIKKTA